VAGTPVAGCQDTQDSDEIVAAVIAISPRSAASTLEDIAASADAAVVAAAARAGGACRTG
jgi:hypothetical protein